MFDHAFHNHWLDTVLIRHAAETTARARGHRAWPSHRHLDMGDMDVTNGAVRIRSEELRTACAAPKPKALA